jgi:hypothetical protein
MMKFQDAQGLYAVICLVAVMLILTTAAVPFLTAKSNTLKISRLKEASILSAMAVVGILVAKPTLDAWGWLFAGMAVILAGVAIYLRRAQH